MARNAFYELAIRFELLQAELQKTRVAEPGNRGRRQEILALMKTTLAAMHAEHRRWVDSLADSQEPDAQKPKLHRASAA